MGKVFKYQAYHLPGYVLPGAVLYHPPLVWRSRLGLIMIVAHHAFVWCHYFFTEKPDMKEIYGNSEG